MPGIDRPMDRDGCICRLLPRRASAFPVTQAGRHPQLHFRGLLGIHSRYGPRSCWPTQGGRCPRGFGRRSCPCPPLGWLPSRADSYSGGSFIRWSSALSWRTEKSRLGTSDVHLHTDSSPASPHSNLNPDFRAVSPTSRCRSSWPPRSTGCARCPRDGRSHPHPKPSMELAPSRRRRAGVLASRS